MIVDDQYYSFSSVFFYTDRRALLLNGRRMNLEYGSYAPNAPQVFIDDSQLAQLWKKTERYYLAVSAQELGRLKPLLGSNAINVMRAAGGKLLLANQPTPGSHPLAEYSGSAGDLSGN